MNRRSKGHVELKKVEGTRCTYEGEIQGFPVPNGLILDVTALNSSGAAIYRGISLFKLENVEPQDVVIVMNAVDDGKGANRPPVIRRVKIDADAILPEDRLSMRVWAHDQDGHAYTGSQHLTMRIPLAGGQAQVFVDRSLSGQWATKTTSCDKNSYRSFIFPTHY